jgi:type II restriction/modification system DNA methylase subunit YeeA
MNTKTFAQQARRLLIDGVAKKLLYWGFDTKGNILEAPQKVSGGYSFRGEVFDDPNVLRLWDSLKQAVQHKTIEVVVEEAAYTWFNRIMALRIMAKNGYEPALLVNAEGLEHTPVLLQRARQGQYSFLNANEQERLKKIIGDYSKEQEAFSILLVGYCHSNTMLNNVFGKIDDYTELLLPDNMLQDSGFLHLLNTTDAISDEEYKEVELIGWLYQFYISEKKDDVFASFKKGKKAEAKDIPAATQIFTPNWIVKYMVQNTAGKIWLDKHPNSPLKTSMKYLVVNENDENVSSSAVENTSIIADVSQLTLIDPAAGSGHILVEGFDLLYQMYKEEYYTPEEAVESILKNNLFGLDIDDRAAQLATFAILLKAAKYYRDVFSKGWLPNVYAMPEEKNFSLQDIKDFLGTEGIAYTEELEAALRLMKQAKNLGSVMKLSVSEDAHNFITKRFNELKTADYLDINLQSIFQNIKTYIPVLLLLSKKFTAVVANPPYLSQRKMNSELKQYLIINYPETQTDLFAVFMEVLDFLGKDNGLKGIINQHSWMFLSSYDKYRFRFLKSNSICSLLHLGPRTFEELGGEVVQSVALVYTNIIDGLLGNYHRLLYEKNVSSKEKSFLIKNNYYKNVSQNLFFRIPKAPLSYWVSDTFYKLFEDQELLADLAYIKVGLDSGNNKAFLRFWHEISTLNFNENASNDITFNYGKWFPYNKGGEFRKWYGNKDYVIDWENDGVRVKASKNSNIRSKHLQLSPSLSWSLLAGNSFGVRYYKNGFLFDNNGRSIIFKNKTDQTKFLDYLNGLLNSKISYHLLSALNPTLAFQIGDLNRLPFIYDKDQENQISKLSINCLEISKKEWDSQETSWDFEKTPLLNESTSLKLAYQKWQENVTKDFFQLHANEEELNRVFIDIYGLQEELTPEVALNDITILQKELNGKDLEKLEPVFRKQGANAISLPINKAEVISQFISYAIGILMGRYRLDKPGLNIAHPNPTAEELASYSYNSSTVTIDEDAILPLMGKNCNFPDDALQQINQLLDTIWGHETRIENSNFIQECLGKELEKFLVKDFYKYHCKMYQKKPIYWLFSSKTGAFQVLVYMHRMNAFTVEKIRANYMMEHLKNLRSEENLLLSKGANLNTQEARRLDQIRKDLIECEAYDMELKNVADQQITFDLDDGVTANYAKFESVLAKIK